MTQPTGRLRRSDRLLLSRDFQRVARQGARVASRDFVILVAPARRDPKLHLEAHPRGPVRRLGITASRKVGPSVTRNRIKRRIREWFRQSRDEFEVDVDVVVIARPGAAGLDGRGLHNQLAALLLELPAAGAKRAVRGG